jgi:hypothetical protein
VADILWSQVVGFAPQLVRITDTDVQDTIVGTANGSLEPLAFGGDADYRYRLARLLLAAHLGVIILSRGDAGKAASETVSKESIAVSYVSGGADTALKLTDYGSELEDMIESSAYARAPIVV